MGKNLAARVSRVSGLKLQDVREYLDECDRVLLSALDDVAVSAPDAGGWTAPQILDHLNRTEMLMYPIWSLVPRLRRFPRAMRLIDRVNSGLWRLAGMRTVVPSARLEPGNAEEGRFRAPVFLQPPSASVTLAELIGRRREIRGHTMVAVNRLDEDTLNSLRWSHPLLGPYSLIEFVQFLGVHERRHVAQIRRLRSDSIGQTGGAKGFSSALRP
jgi:hypothetical protein